VCFHLGVAETQLRDYQARLGSPFGHDVYLTQLAAIRDRLKACLACVAPEPTVQPPPSAAALAAQMMEDCDRARAVLTKIDADDPMLRFPLARALAKPGPAT